MDNTRDWQQFFENLTEEEKYNVAALRIIECTNGCIQWAFRRKDPWALSVEETRKAMKFSMSCINSMEIPMGESTISFSEPLVEVFSEIRELYVRGAKNADAESFDEFQRISGIMVNVLGEERIRSVHEDLKQSITEIDPDKLTWGVQYMLQFLG